MVRPSALNSAVETVALQLLQDMAGCIVKLLPTAHPVLERNEIEVTLRLFAGGLGRQLQQQGFIEQRPQV
jgi:hypothetical protein